MSPMIYMREYCGQFHHHHPLSHHHNQQHIIRHHHPFRILNIIACILNDIPTIIGFMCIIIPFATIFRIISIPSFKILRTQPYHHVIPFGFPFYPYHLLAIEANVEVIRQELIISKALFL